MKKSIYLSLCFFIFIYFQTPGCLAGIILTAGAEVKGKVFDAGTGQPLEYATVRIYRFSDSAFIVGAVTNSAGQFTLDNVEAGQYFVMVQAIGYKKMAIRDFVIPEKLRKVEMPDILLSPGVYEINGIEVVGTVNPVDFKPDKRVVNVAQNPAAAGGSAVDVLVDNGIMKTDANGEATLRNSNNYLVLVDGKQSVFNGTEALLQIQANTVDRIEVITNPSAKYQAEGDAGIINIILKKQKLQGISGNLNAAYSSVGSYSADAMIGLKRNNHNLYVGADIKETYASQYFEFNRVYRINDTTWFNDQIVDQYGIRPASNLRFGIDLDLNERNSLSFITTIGTNDFRKTKAVYNKLTLQETLQPEYYSNNEWYNVDGYFLKPLITYNHSFGQKKNAFSVDLSYTYINSDFGQLSKDFISDINFRPVGSVENILRSANNYKRYIFEIKSDWVINLNGGRKIEAGLDVSGNKRDAEVVFEEFDNNNQIWFPYSDYSNSITFDQWVYAAFAMISGQFMGLDYQFGLRSETTDRILQMHSSTTDYSYFRNHFFPSLHLSRQFSENTTLQLSITRRINRPVDIMLNPYPSSVSKSLITIGNPEISPEISDAVELNFASEKGKISAGVSGYYRLRNNALSQVTGLNSDGRNVISYGNLVYEKNLGVELSAGFNSPAFKVFPSLDVYYFVTKGNFGTYQADFNALSFSAGLNTTIRLFGNPVLQFIGEYNGKSVTQQGTIGSFYSLSVSLKQEFLKKKLTCTVHCRRLFASGQVRMEEQGADFFNKVYYATDNNVLTVNLSYKFNNFVRNRKLQGNDVIETF